MNADFPRILTLLRKEKGISQKTAAGDLGISQALLSHYEKGIRECGLDFLVRTADYYGVSCDYLLGRSPDRSGTTLTVEDIPEPDVIGKENVMHGSILPVLNKKLIANSMNILFDLLQKTGGLSLCSGGYGNIGSQCSGSCLWRHVGGAGTAKGDRFSGHYHGVAESHLSDVRLIFIKLNPKQ